MTHRAKRIGLGSVGCAAGKMLFVRFPGEIGRDMLVEQPVRLIGLTRDTTAAGAARPLCTPIDLAASIGVGPGIDGVSQERLVGRTLGTAPLQPPVGRAFASAYPQRDALLHERTHQGMPRAQVVQLPKGNDTSIRPKSVAV